LDEKQKRQPKQPQQPQQQLSEAPEKELDNLEELGKLCRQLEKLGVTRGTTGYDGYGDEGTLDKIAFEPANREVPDELEEELADVLENLLPTGWEINEGSFGTLELDVAKRTVVREHNDRSAEIERTEVEPDLPKE